MLSQDGKVAEISGIEASVKSDLTDKVGEISSVEYSSAFAETYLKEFVSTRVNVIPWLCYQDVEDNIS